MGRILVTKEWYMSECSYFLQSGKSPAAVGVYVV